MRLCCVFGVGRCFFAKRRFGVGLSVDVENERVEGAEGVSEGGRAGVSHS